MRNVEMLADWVDELAKGMRRHVAPLAQDAVSWQPDPAANSVGLTLWHVARWLDLVTVILLQDRDAGDELWFANGWAAKTAYDPRGVGFDGYGAITGYSLEQAAAVPEMTATDLLTYLDEAAHALRAQLTSMDDAGLDAPAPGSKRGITVYAWLKAVLFGCFGHVGEIEGMLGMRSRAAAAAE